MSRVMVTTRTLARNFSNLTRGIRGSKSQNSGKEMFLMLILNTREII